MIKEDKHYKENSKVLRDEELFVCPQIAIVGVGGAGNNTLNRFAILGESYGIDEIAINTDKYQLDSIRCKKKILLGKSLTRGLGAGGSPDVGRKAAELDKETIRRLLRGKNLVFLTAGMGGGTGTGVTPVIAKIAKEEGAIVIAMVFFPFESEKKRRKMALEGIKELREATDTVVVLENEKLIEYAGNIPVDDAFRSMDMLIGETIQGIVEMITKQSLVNLDFADLRSVMGEGGVAVMLVGKTKQLEKRAEAVVEDVISHQFLDVNYRGATGALVHVTGGVDLTIQETIDIIELLTLELDSDANVIWGTRIDDECTGEIRVTAIFTGVEPKWVFGGVHDYQEKLSTKGRSKLEETIAII